MVIQITRQNSLFKSKTKGHGCRKGSCRQGVDSRYRTVLGVKIITLRLCTHEIFKYQI